jgi:hypothetical protein
MTQKLDGKQLAEVTADSLNTFGFSGDIEAFVNEMGNQHRTLQQTFTGLCAKWLIHLAEQGKEGRFDLRNEDSVEFAMEIKPQLDKAFFRFI